VQRYVIRRLLQAIPVLGVVSLIVFTSLNILPGDPITARQGTNMTAGYQEVVEQLRRQHGLDRPLPEQYVRWVLGALTGDLGISYVTERPVAGLIAERAPATAELAILSLLIGLLIAVPTAIIAGVKQGTWLDALVTGFVSIGMAVPAFWLAIMLMLLFAVKLGWLPTVGHEPFFGNPIANLQHAALPATTLGLILAAPLMRFLRSSVLETIRQEYVMVARAKGLAGRDVLLRHVLKNALIPTITVLGIQLGQLLGGVVIVEWVFAWPGMGWLTVDGVFQRDYSVVQGTVTLIAVVFVGINLVIDLLYAALDPRIRYS
jgi:peptide/nickel transport system permease protein